MRKIKVPKFLLNFRRKRFIKLLENIGSGKFEIKTEDGQSENNGEQAAGEYLGENEVRMGGEERNPNRSDLSL